MTFRELAQLVFGDVTRPGYESVARACRTLAKRGHVSLELEWGSAERGGGALMPALTEITRVSRIFVRERN